MLLRYIKFDSSVLLTTSTSVATRESPSELVSPLAAPSGRCIILISKVLMGIPQFPLRGVQLTAYR